ncbi:hypothetical protein HJC23_012365 [Cyclotella cryptica]|uniref:AAA+ ATPase domain-containing protein n=1 Tax=Cyclotella cryptica TaxID=29204 RepID=A0ABD3QDR2_9STRA
MRKKIVQVVANRGAQGAKLSHLTKEVKGFPQVCQGVSPLAFLQYHMKDDLLSKYDVQGKVTLFFLKSNSVEASNRDNESGHSNDSTHDQIATLIREFDRIDISKLPSEYEQKYSIPLSHTGKLRKLIEGIPGIKLERQGSLYYARWRECGNKNEFDSEKHNDQSFGMTYRDETKSIDATADIISFQEVLHGKAKVSTAIAKNDHKDHPKTTADEFVSSFFGLQVGQHSTKPSRKFSLVDSSKADDLSEAALLGYWLPSSTPPVSEPVYLNTHEPFCFATVGVQGAGKSHTSSCVLESCLTPFETGSVVKLKAPMTSLVLHYDQSTKSICESAGLLLPDSSLLDGMASFGMGVGHVPKDKAVLLVSPSYFHQRKKFYGDNLCTVRPLLFTWKSLTADHIKRIMRIENGDNQLYVASFLDLLRSYQRKGLVPDFPSFLSEVRKVCSVKGQSGPLDQRIALLESVVAESDKNLTLVNESADLITTLKDGKYFIIADLTDPLLSKEEANGLFQVLTEQFRTLPTKGGKVLFLDEAHKYMSGVQSDGLSEAIVNVARLMRHDGVRLIVSTQSPKALAPELLELVTVGCLHHFHSPDWWDFLKVCVLNRAIAFVS